MATAATLLNQLAVDLDDANPPFARWSQESLLFYMQEALSLIYVRRPSKYTKSVVLELRSGSFQQADKCQKIKKVLYQCDQYGNMLNGELVSVDPRIRQLWQKGGCPDYSAADFRLEGYYKDASEDNTFTVFPPVPPRPEGAKVYVRILCAQMPEVGELTDTVSWGEDTPAVMQWCLFRAQFVDSESQGAQEAAVRHLAEFYKLSQLSFASNTINRMGDLTTDDARKELTALRMAGLIGGNS